MDYHNVRNAKTYEEFIYLINRANVPHDVQKHVTDLLDNHIEQTNNEVHAIYTNYLSELLNNIGKLCADLIAVEGRAADRKRQQQEAITGFMSSLEANLTGETEATIFTAQFVRGLKAQVGLK